MKRTFLLGGREITLDALSPQLDATFEKLHAAFYGNAPLSWDEFAVAAAHFFDDNIRNWGAHDAYFNNFTVIWQDLLANGRHAAAEHLWFQALQPAWQWEQARTQRLHKGTAYYFWAMTSLLYGDIDRGYLLSHQAFQEDVATSGQPTPDTPGYALISLNYKKDNQAFLQWVRDQASFLDAFLTDYNKKHRRTLTLADVKRRFFDAPPSHETVFLFTYTLARLMNIARLPNATTTNPFAGQLEINLLFDITLVIDTAISTKNPQKTKPQSKKQQKSKRTPEATTFVNQAEHLLRVANHPLQLAQLGQINTQFKNFDSTLLAAINGKFAIPPSPTFDRLQCDVALAYGIRNYGAHNTGTAPTIYNRFEEVQQALFRVFFATIDHLY